MEELFEVLDKVDDEVIDDFMDWDNPVHALKAAYLKGKDEKSKPKPMFTNEERQTLFFALVRAEEQLRKELRFKKDSYFDQEQYKKDRVMHQRIKRLGTKVLDSLEGPKFSLGVVRI
jgi:hypothetical protein